MTDQEVHGYMTDYEWAASIGRWCGYLHENPDGYKKGTQFCHPWPGRLASPKCVSAENYREKRVIPNKGYSSKRRNPYHE